MKNISILLLTFILLTAQDSLALDLKLNSNIFETLFNGALFKNISSSNLQNALLLRRGGGSRGRSFGGSRSRSRPSAKSRQRSAAQKKQKTQRQAQQKREKAKRPSFGGNKMSSSAAKKQYGTPRKTTQMAGKSNNGVRQNYNVHHYGGYGTGLMTGYMLGSSMWYWRTPFHPAFYYSRPTYVDNGSGQYDVYPPTFSYMKLFIVLIIIFAIIYFIRRRKKSGKSNESTSSFS